MHLIARINSGSLRFSYKEPDNIQTTRITLKNINKEMCTEAAIASIWECTVTRILMVQCCRPLNRIPISVGSLESNG